MKNNRASAVYDWAERHCSFCGQDKSVCNECRNLDPLGKKLSEHIQKGLHEFLPGCYFGPDDVYKLLMDKYKVIEALSHAEEVINSYQMDIRASKDWLATPIDDVYEAPVDLVALGFCQGSLYLKALEKIKSLREGLE